MKNIYLLFITIIFTVLFNVTGCSSGGGDGAPAVQPLSYVGKTDPADITLTSAPTLLVNVIHGTSTASDMVTGVQASTSNPESGNAAIATDYIETLLHYSLNNSIGSAFSGYYIPLGLAINETLGCDSGYITMQGTVDDMTGAGDLAVNYVNCVLDGTTYNGSGTMTVHYIDVYTESMSATFYFPLLKVSSPDYSGAISGSISVDDSYNYGIQLNETITLNVVISNDTAVKMYKFENYMTQISISNVYDCYSGATQALNGAVYDSIHGGMTVQTINPLSISSCISTHPESGGPLIMIGNAAKMQLTVESNKHVLLEFDLDNNGVYEIVRYVLWQEFDDYVSIDLADRDDDGMHNSWETLYTLNPDVDDADVDDDFDGYTNLQEYQGGSNPLLPSSTPLAP